jgi:hypothetical protein
MELVNAYQDVKKTKPKTNFIRHKLNYPFVLKPSMRLQMVNYQLMNHLHNVIINESSEDAFIPRTFLLVNPGGGGDVIIEHDEECVINEVTIEWS